MLFKLKYCNFYESPTLVKASFPRVNVRMEDAICSDKGRVHASEFTTKTPFALVCLKTKYIYRHEKRAITGEKLDMIKRLF